MKENVLFYFVLIISIEGNSQNILGKWYGINRSGLIEFNLTSDTLKMQVLRADLNSKGFERGQRNHLGIYSLNDRVLIVFPDKGDVSKYRAITIFNIKDKESCEISTNGLNTVSETIDDLILANRNDTTELFGHLLFSEYYLPALRKMKNIDQMPLQDFKLFLNKYIIKRKQYELMKENMAGTLTDQLITRTLVEMNYNPINAADVIDRHFEKFFDDKEVTELLKKI